MSQISFKVPWGAIRGLSFGNATSPSKVLCLHGWQDNCGLFRPMLEKLPQDKHYIAIDLMGHGLSDPLPPGFVYNFTHYLYGIQYVVSQLGLNTFSIIGHSMGGNIAGLYSSIYPECVEKIVLMDAAGMPFIREYASHVRKSVDQVIEFESQPKRENNEYEKAVLKERLSIGLQAINSHLTDQALDYWFVRGATETENGKFRINRDIRLNLASPPAMGFDQMTSLHNIFLESDISMLYLRPKDPSDLTGNMYKDMNQFIKLTKEFVMKSLENKRNSIDYVQGGHHFYINNPADTAKKISKFFD